MKDKILGIATAASIIATPSLAQERDNFADMATQAMSAGAQTGSQTQSGTVVYTDPCDIVEDNTGPVPIYLQNNDPACDTKYVVSYDVQTGETLEDEIGDQFIRVEKLFSEMLGE